MDGTLVRAPVKMDVVVVEGDSLIRFRIPDGGTYYMPISLAIMQIAELGELLAAHQRQS